MKIYFVKVMKLTSNIFIPAAVVFMVWLSFFGSGCAQIGFPTGGIKDSLPPVLVKATPLIGSKNVSANRISLEFDEYIDVTDITNNLLVSPLQNKTPTIIINPKSITFKFRDTLLPNTTYNINFGDAIKDINENNILKNFSYVFSTGNRIDSLSLAGTVVMAETGLADSTLQVLLYRNTADSAVQKKRPDYIARLNGEGKFSFKNLPSDNFKLYALKDGDGSKNYNGKTEIFAFTNEIVNPSAEENNTILYAYAEQNKEEAKTTEKPAKLTPAKKISYITNLQQKQDLLQPFEIFFSSPLKDIDTTKIYFTDTSYNRITGINYLLDSTAKKLTLSYKWTPDADLRLIINKDALKDSAGLTLAKTDTIKFSTRLKEDYGRLTLRFTGLDILQNPVIQFMLGDKIAMSFPLTSSTFSNAMFTPGEYGIRILYDTNKDGKWTTGNYTKKLQPERVTAIPQKISIRADWDNERDVNL